MTLDISKLLSQPEFFQQLTVEDLDTYGPPQLVTLSPPITGDTECDQKRRNWIEWRAASYPAKRHSEYLFDPHANSLKDAPKTLVSAVMPPPTDFDEYVIMIRSDKRFGRKADGRRAVSRGYTTRHISPSEYSRDISEIINSSTERQGRKISPLFANRPQDWSFPDYKKFSHIEYMDICIGTFDCNDKLVAYILGKRVGHHVQYDEIMGHADHIANDVMYLLHFDFLRFCSTLEVIPQCLNYGPWYSGEDPYSPNGGLNAWKRRIGFKPAYLILASS